jgi:tRNA A37 threonylcarbamoyladenosine dehydratase
MRQLRRMDFGLDPVQRVAHQTHALVGVKALDGFHQAHIAFLNEVGVGQAIAQVLARH